MEKIILEELYSLYVVDYDVCDSVEFVLGMMYADCLTIKEDKELSSDAIKGNKYDIFITKLQNIFNIFGEDDYAWIEEDNLLLEQQIDLSDKYLGYYKKLRDIINDENYKEIYKLVSFMGENYALNFEYYENLRDSINLASQGIGFYCSDDRTDNRVEFNELFNREYNRISLIKPVQKKK